MKKLEEKDLVDLGSMRLNEVLSLVPISRTTLWRWEKAGKFPKRIPLGENSIAWNRAEVEEWYRAKYFRRTA